MQRRRSSRLCRDEARAIALVTAQLELIGPEKIAILGGDCLVIAIDETGLETLKDKGQPFFGFGGCGFMVSDYEKLVDVAWGYMAKRFFADIKRPLHASDIQHSKDQIEALNHFFTKFEFFRVAAVMSAKATYTTEAGVVELLANALLLRILEIAKQTSCKGIALIFEENQRIEAQVISSLFGKSIKRGDEDISFECFLMPKAACFSALEAADYIAHTAGRAVRHRNESGKTNLPDFDKIFHGVDKRLISFMEITSAELRP